MNYTEAQTNSWATNVQLGTQTGGQWPGIENGGRGSSVGHHNHVATPTLLFRAAVVFNYLI